jgi:hypothetical protein
MKRKLTILFLVIVSIPLLLKAQDPKVTEDWSKEPPVITPGNRMKPPSDAIVLFKKGRDIANWASRKGGPARWKTSCRKMTTSRTGDVVTKQEFGDCQLHIEWRTPRKVVGQGQGRGNSGVYLQSLYEVQVLDSYENVTYYNGQAGSIYKQSPPLVNASRGPGKWQYYDIVFRAPRFNDDGSLKSPGTITVFHNGVLIQNHFELKGKSVYAGFPKYEPHSDKMPLLLQDHGNPVSYRNIWIREL